MAHLLQAGATRFGVSSSVSHFSLHHQVQLKLRLGPRIVLTLFLLVATTSQLCGDITFFTTNGALAQDTATSRCEDIDNGTQCTCDKVSGNQQDLTATVSATRSVLQLLCKTGLTWTPAGADNKQVCPEATDDLKNCKKDGGKPTCIDVTTLLAGSTDGIKWQDVTGESQGNTKGKQLTIPAANLPYSDKKFIVGCLSSDQSTSKCKLTVTLEARPSVTEKNHTVTCAYGKTSNPTHQTVKLSPSQNSFTLVCGSEGEVLPTKYQDTYCGSKDGESAAAKQCSGNYTEVIPTYENTWWEETKDKTSYSLVIPSDSFPEEETKITLGCQKKASTSGDRTREEATAAASTVCTVDVTIEGVTSSASLSRGMDGVLFWVVGFGAMSIAFACL
ncbi:srs domain-containing protein [Neospora caninum Liverpool]|uniref:Srs domain-containing protein n=1 Tax=Neospora caninum (strain Liverpool) TaxID=572307 RepID=F0VAW4_NEOCL|nr:srs domain-containing protein [Neospora caninum Liverpool]CBZ50822.1 srs domain-containing protein [Neospora caninum Liverpool]CEL68123.1 TPA: SRS domain-containing protein [Neospora caninum Liverpool]|eukprot:XP_003880855.1 srs domain-containing protein [Neospora caninum Liverpool]